jgi:riboflavin transporter FmnP
MKMKTRTLAGTATLAALAVVLDYALRYSYWKIPFPWMPNLKFDFTGIPIVLSTLLYGLTPGAITSIVASVAIFARSSNAVSSSMKGIAEFSTVLGMAIGLKLCHRFRAVCSSALGLVFRVAVMIVANIAMIYVGLMPLTPGTASISLAWGLIVGVFNFMQGVLSIFGGYFIYEVIRKRVPTLFKDSQGISRADFN